MRICAAPHRRLAAWHASLLLALLLAATPGRGDQLTELLTGAGTDEPATAERVISAENTASDDAKIRNRLKGIFSELSSLQGVSAEVNGGVVTLRGEVDSAASETRALQFARQIEGVVEVENSLSINRDLQPRLETTGRKLIAVVEQTIAGLPLFGMAVLVVLLFYLAGRWLAARKSLYRRISPNHFIAALLGQITQLVFLVLGLVVALALLDATALLGTILGAAGIVGLAVGFAVRDTVENYIASILLSVRNPFEINDFVAIDRHEGNVVTLTSRATVLISPDGNHIRIPNATVFKAVITNYTRHPERRFDFAVGVDTEQDLAAAQALAQSTLDDVTGISSDLAAFVLIETLGDSNVVLRCHAWVDQKAFSFAKVRSEAIRAVKQAFDNAGIVMPEPIYKVRLSHAAARAPVEEKQPADTGTTVPHTNADPPQTGDVSVDRTIEGKVEAEDKAAGDANLLGSGAPAEY